jgi:phage gp29-like protein
MAGDYLLGPDGKKIPLKKEQEHFASRDRVGMFLNLIWNVLPDPDPLLAKIGKSYSGLRELMMDEQFETAWTSRLAAVQRTPWDIIPGGTDRAAKKTADFCKDIYKNFKLNLINIGLMEYCLLGFSAAELLWNTVGTNWVPLDIVPKPQEWFGFDKDNRLVLRVKNGKTEDLPPGRFILIQNRPSFVNPYGVKLLSKIFWSITFKRNGAKWWAVFTEKFGGAFATAKYRPGAPEDEINKIISMLEDLVSCGVAAFPEGTTLEVVTDQTKGAASSNFSDFERFFNENISKVILGATLTTDIGSNGSYSAAQVHNDVRNDIALSDRETLAEAHNDILGRITRFNFGEDAISPRFSWEEPEDLKASTAERDAKLYAIGWRPTKEYFSQTYGISEEQFELGPEVSQGTGPSFKDTPGIPKGLFALEEKTDEDTKAFLAKEAARAQIELNSLMEEYNGDARQASSYEEAFQMMVKRYSKQTKFRKRFASIIDNIRYAAAQLASNDEKHGN